MAWDLGFGKEVVSLLAFGLGVLVAPCALAEPEASQLRVIRPGPEPLPPRVLKAEPGTSLPAGYHAEQRIRLGPTIGGGVVCGFGLAMIFSGIETNEYAGEVQGGAAASTVNYSGLLYVLGGINLAVGVPLLLYGLLDKKDVYVRDQVALRFTPTVSAGYAGAALSGAF